MDTNHNAHGATPINYTTKEAARLLCYKDTKSLLDATHRDGIPHIKQNARRILFPSAALHAWISRRTVGGNGGAS
jgi:hypothetical protein